MSKSRLQSCRNPVNYILFAELFFKNTFYTIRFFENVANAYVKLKKNGEVFADVNGLLYLLELLRFQQLIYFS